MNPGEPALSMVREMATSATALLAAAPSGPAAEVSPYAASEQTRTPAMFRLLGNPR